MKNHHSNSEHTLWQGHACLIAGETEYSINCRVFSRTPEDLQIYASAPSAIRLLGEVGQDTLKLDLPGLIEPAEVFVRESSWNGRGEGILWLHLRRSPIWFLRSERLHFGRSLVVNLSQCWMGSPKKLAFSLKSSGWLAVFVPVSEETLALPAPMRDDDYRVTYQVEFAREDGSSFGVTDAQQFLSDLSIFLSFCQGHWVGTSFTTVQDRDGVVALEQWGTGRLNTSRELSGWLDEHHGESIIQLYETFYAKLQDSSWNRALNTIVYWLGRADTNIAGPDGACILLQATLERLAWHILIVDRKVISKSRFEGLNAADQIRQMLKVLSIPVAIPQDLKGLTALAKPKGLDGPRVFTYIRNRLVHPPKTDGSESLPFCEAYSLAKWYVELSVLSACGYSGLYSNRTLGSRWKGQVGRVPWA